MPIGHPKIVFTARDAAGEVVRELEYPSAEWYDGDVPLIDEDGERRTLGVRTIEGEQTDSSGRVYRRWRNIYDNEGRWVDSEVWDDWKPTIPEPPRGQSAYDQVKKLGLFPAKPHSKSSQSEPPDTRTRTAPDAPVGEQLQLGLGDESR